MAVACWLRRIPFARRSTGRTNSPLGVARSAKLSARLAMGVRSQPSKFIAYASAWVLRSSRLRSLGPQWRPQLEGSRRVLLVARLGSPNLDRSAGRKASPLADSARAPLAAAPFRIRGDQRPSSSVTPRIPPCRSRPGRIVSGHPGAYGMAGGRAGEEERQRRRSDKRLYFFSLPPGHICSRERRTTSDAPLMIGIFLGTPL